MNDVNISPRNLIIVSLFALINVFWGLGGVPLLDANEPVTAQTVREMIEYSDYLSPRIFNEFCFDKAPLYYWLVSASMLILGDGEVAIRFTSALMAVATSVMMYFIVTEIFSEKAGFWSALILSSCTQFFYLGKAAVNDTTLLFFITASLLCYIKQYYWFMYVAMALATMTEGLVGLTVPIITILIHSLLINGWRGILRLKIFRGALLFVFITLPWFWLMYNAHGIEFLREFFGLHNFERFFTPKHMDRAFWWYYFPVLLVGIFPWTGILLQSIRASISQADTEELKKMLFFNLWCIFVLAFFSVAQTKSVAYILPLFPPLAIIIGWNIARMQSLRDETFYGWSLGTIFTFIGIAAVWYSAIEYFPEIEFECLALGCVTLVNGLVIVWFLVYDRDVEWGAIGHILASFLTMLIVTSFLLPPVADRFSVKTIARDYIGVNDTTSEVYVDEYLRAGFLYYTGIKSKEIIPETEDLSKALNDSERKYVIVRGLEYRRLNDADKIKNTKVLAEKSDIFLIEKY